MILRLRIAIPLLLVVFVAACGASPAEQHEVLNHITDVGDPTYALVLETCDVAREVVKARQNTTYEEDMAALTEIGEVCLPLVEAFETLIGAQRTARDAIDDGAEGAVLTGIQEALRLWASLQALVPQLQTLGQRPTSGGEGE